MQKAPSLWTHLHKHTHRGLCWWRLKHIWSAVKRQPAPYCTASPSTLHCLTWRTAPSHPAHCTWVHFCPKICHVLHVVCPLSWDCRRWRHLQACMFCACCYRRADVCFRSRHGHSSIKTVIPEFWQRFRTVLMERTPPVSHRAQRRCVPMYRPGTVGSRISVMHIDDDQVIMLWRLDITMRMLNRHRPLLIKSVVLPFVCFFVFTLLHLYFFVHLSRRSCTWGLNESGWKMEWMKMALLCVC